jgi:hypothetical protein
MLEVEDSTERVSNAKQGGHIMNGTKKQTTWIAI